MNPLVDIVVQSGGLDFAPHIRVEKINEVLRKCEQLGMKKASPTYDFFVYGPGDPLPMEETYYMGDSYDCADLIVGFQWVDGAVDGVRHRFYMSSQLYNEVVAARCAPHESVVRAIEARIAGKPIEGDTLDVSPQILRIQKGSHYYVDDGYVIVVERMTKFICHGPRMSFVSEGKI